MASDLTRSIRKSRSDCTSHRTELPVVGRSSTTLLFRQRRVEAVVSDGSLNVLPVGGKPAVRAAWQ